MDLINEDSVVGARVYGMPMSANVADYIEDVSLDADKDLLFSMYFAGKFANVSSSASNDFFYEDLF